MADYEDLSAIPMSGMRQEMALQVAPAPKYDIAGDVGKAYGLASEIGKVGDEQKKRASEAKLTEYLKNGGNLGTPEGAKKAIDDLKGQIDFGTYEKIVDLGSKFEDHASKVADELAKKPAQELAYLDNLADLQVKYLQGPLAAYEAAAKTDGKVKALDTYKSALQATIKDAQSNPVISKVLTPEKIAKLMEMSPEAVKSQLVDTTNYQRKLFKQAAETSRINAQAELYTNKAGDTAEGLSTLLSELRADPDSDPVVIKAIESRLAKTGAGAGGTGKTRAMPMLLDGKPAQLLLNNGVYTTLDGKIVDSPETRVKPLQAGIGARGEQVLTRIQIAAEEAAGDLANIAKLPMTVSTGILGGRKQGPSILDASKEALANRMTSQEVESYNTMSAGIQRSLAAVEAAGMIPSGSLTHAMDTLTFKEGNSNQTKLLKLAQTRQIIERGLNPYINNPKVDPDTKVYLRKLQDELKTAIPFTVEEATAFDQRGKNRQTIKDYMTKRAAKASPSDFPKVTPQQQKAADSDRTAILQKELESEQAALAASPQDPLRQRNVELLQREIQAASQGKGGAAKLPSSSQSVSANTNASATPTKVSSDDRTPPSNTHKIGERAEHKGRAVEFVGISSEYPKGWKYVQ